jgi:GTP diphosphokinase / guanosine-3',5'-bis(diphosphate) 3'-diphosphatase
MYRQREAGERHPESEVLRAAVGCFATRPRILVQEVSDDKDLSKAERKRKQVEHAGHLSRSAKLVKLADKTANLRDVADCPPPDWSLVRRRENFDWAREVVDAIGPAHAELREVFGKALATRP